MSQLEVTPRIQRRRRFTDAEKQQILAEADATSISAVCRKHDVARSLVKRWKMVFEGAPFAQLRLPAPDSTSSDGTVRIELPGPITLHFPATVDPESLATFVRSLGAPR